MGEKFQGRRVFEVAQRDDRHTDHHDCGVSGDHLWCAQDSVKTFAIEESVCGVESWTFHIFHLRSVSRRTFPVRSLSEKRIRVHHLQDTDAVVQFWTCGCMDDVLHLQ